MLGNENTAFTLYTNKLCLQIHRGSEQTESRAALLGKKITDGVYISVCFKCLSVCHCLLVHNQINEKVAMQEGVIGDEVLVYQIIQVNTCTHMSCFYMQENNMMLMEM